MAMGAGAGWVKVGVLGDSGEAGLGEEDRAGRGKRMRERSVRRVR
jgi:hypothetical protein